jgi:hypothetical protein
MIKRIVIYPFLIAVYPLIALLAVNIDQVEGAEVIRPLMVAFLLTLILLLAFMLIFRNWHKAGLGTSLILVLFFSYGHVYNLLSHQLVAGVEIGRHRFLILITAILLFGGGYLIWSKISSPEKFTPILNFIAVVMLIYPLYTITSFYLEDTGEISPVSAAPPTSPQVSLDSGQYPDIYYLIFDSYGRQDILQTNYKLDNSQFLSDLTEIGFYVADQSRSNYSQTTLSLSSSLNMDYVPTFMESIDEDNLNTEPLRAAIKDSRVRDMLASMGYSMVAFDSTTRMTQIEDADVYLTANLGEKSKGVDKTLINVGTITPFEMIFIESSAGVILTDMASQCITLQDQAAEADSPPDGAPPMACRLAGWIIPHVDYPYSNLRSNILYTFDKLPDLGEESQPRFVFAHLIAPHFPFVFGPNGEFSRQTNAFSLGEEGGFVGSRQTYIDGYTDEIIFINNRLLETLKQLIANSDPAPIIIIQADHGAHGNMIPGEAELLPIPFYQERFAILNAYFLPNCDTSNLYPGITPVNSFRVVFNSCFGQDFDLLEDKSYFSSYSSPYKFIDVTQETINTN